MDTSLRILVVDDFPMMREILRDALDDIGFRAVAEAGDGAAALQVLRAQRFDLVIADQNMPHMSGVELLRAIRSDARLAHTPVIMVTAEPRPGPFVEAAEAGANAYLVKPFTAQELRERIARVLGQVATAA